MYERNINERNFLTNKEQVLNYLQSLQDEYPNRFTDTYKYKFCIPYVFGDISEELQKDVEIILAAARVPAFMHTLYITHKPFFRSNREYMKMLLYQHLGIDILEQEDLEDIEYMHIFLRDKSSNVEYTRNKIGREKFNQLIDKKLALSLVRSWGNNLQYFEKYQDDEEIVLAAYETDKSSIQYASPRLQYRLQNITFDKEHATDEALLPSSLNSVEEKLVELKDLRENASSYLNPVNTLTSEKEENGSKVKQKIQNEVKINK